MKLSMFDSDENYTGEAHRLANEISVAVKDILASRKLAGYSLREIEMVATESIRETVLDLFIEPVETSAP